LEALFSKIASAKVPDKFTHSFLQQTIGLKGVNDRAFIPLLRTLGFLDPSGTPTPAYRKLKNSATAKVVLAIAVRAAYAPLFEANEQTHKLPPDKLKGLIAQVAGTDEDMTARIASTFNALAKLADFVGAAPESDSDAPKKEQLDEKAIERQKEHARGAIKPEFHYNIQIHLPSNATEEAYLNIFNALRKVFQ
jgi:hypothetical protein